MKLGVVEKGNRMDDNLLTPFDRGMLGSQQSATKWSDGEVQMVDLAIQQCARDLDTFTADDVWDRLPEGFRVTKGLASRLKVAKNRGWIRSDGEVRHSKRSGEHGHGQRLNVWVSCRRMGSGGPQPSASDQRLADIKEDLTYVLTLLAEGEQSRAVELAEEMLRAYW